MEDFNFHIFILLNYIILTILLYHSCYRFCETPGNYKIYKNTQDINTKLRDIKKIKQELSEIKIILQPPQEKIENNN